MYDLSKYDFVDFGCGDGGSIRYCKKRFMAGNGLGIDIRQSKVDKALAAGVDAICGDILELEGRFRFVSMMDFLEHLPSLARCKETIRKASELATDFLFIRHPSFEHVEYLEQLGLKITWTDWRGHTAPLRLTDFCEIFADLDLNSYCIVHRNPITSSHDPVVVPFGAPVDTIQYDEQLGERPFIQFPRPLFGQLDLFVALRPLDGWASIVSTSRPRTRSG